MHTREVDTRYINSLLASGVKLDSFFALPQYLPLAADDAGGVATHLQINNDAEIILPVIFSKFKLMGLSVFNVATCPAPPQIISKSLPPSKREKVLLEIVSYLRTRYGCKIISITQRPHDPKFIRSNLDGYTASHNYDIVIDLSNELRTIYYGMDKRHRYTLRKASGCSNDELLSSDWLQKAGFTIKQGANQESLRKFRVLWIKTLMRMYEGFNPLRKFLYRDSLALNSLITVFNKLYPYGLVKLFTMYDENGQPGASAIFYTSNNFTKTPMAYWSAGASSEEGRRNGLPTLLQWYVIQRFKERGCERYYMGGYNVKNLNDGPSLFKRGFGGQIVSGSTVTWWVQPISALYGLASYTARLTSAIKKVF